MPDTQVMTRKDAAKELVELKGALVTLSMKDVLSKGRSAEVAVILDRYVSNDDSQLFLILSKQIEKTAKEVVQDKERGIKIQRMPKGFGGNLNDLVKIVERAKTTIAKRIASQEALLKAL